MGRLLTKEEVRPGIPFDVEKHYYRAPGRETTLECSVCKMPFLYVDNYGYQRLSTMTGKTINSPPGNVAFSQKVKEEVQKHYRVFHDYNKKP